jgi:16S rRNA A1518/A1519 N6-dimethyltransferase RsmA/KsgA/DIM1 with predicted DNA glycosylase/AP lyase activity
MIDYEELLNIVKNEDDLEEFLTHENKYEYLYNLSSIRRNILDWFDFDEDARLLEIGAECGALTGLFCERVKEVIAIEEDEKKREINEARNDEKYLVAAEVTLAIQFNGKMR